MQYQVPTTLQIFNPLIIEDTSSALNVIGRDIDNVNELCFVQKDSTLLHKKNDFSLKSGKFFHQTEVVSGIKPIKNQTTLGFSYFILFLIPIFISLIILRTSFARFQASAKALFNNRMSAIFIKNFEISNAFSSYLIYFNNAICLALISWLWLKHNNLIILDKAYTFLTFLIISTLAYTIYRYFIIFLLKTIFQTDEDTSQYLYKDYFIKIIFSTTTPFLIFALAYIQKNYFLWYIMVLLLAITLLYKIVISFYVGIKEHKYGIFYFILYLCAVEIAPIAIIYRMLTDLILI